MKTDGSDFWAPWEGLTCAINVLRLVRSYVEDGHAKPLDCSRDRALRHLAGLVKRSKSLQVRVLQHCRDNFRFGLPIVPAAGVRRMDVRSQGDAHLLCEVRRHMEQYQRACLHDKMFRYRKLTIDYPLGTVEFTEESYFAFILRSLDQIQRWIETGRMEQQ